MKVKSFQTYLENRLNNTDIKAIEQAAQMEAEAFRALKKDVSDAVIHYMSENNIGFNEFVQKIGKSPTQVSKIIKGEANLTLASIAQLYAIMGHQAHIV